MKRSKMEEVYEKATNIRCESCGAGFTTGQKGELGYDIKTESDVDDAYDVVECCGDPLYVAVIASDRPLFPEDDPESQVNEDAHISPNPRINIMDHRWDYELGPDFFAALEKQEEVG